MNQRHSKGYRHRDRKKPHQHGPPREKVEELHPTDNVPEIENFKEWDLGEEVQRAIFNMDITRPTPIQALAIGPVLAGKDVIAKAETGTGKTLAFGAPMMAKIDPARSTVLGLVLCPTRELAQQVCDVLAALALPRGVKVVLVVGGDPMQPQVAALQGGAQVVVGTPGRVLDLYQQRFLSFPWTEFVVLDEADKMFEIGFIDDIKKILSFTPEERSTLMFSATFPTEVLKLARSSTTDPVEIATQRGTATVDSIDQTWMKVDDDDRPLALLRMFEQSEPKDVFLVFCDRRTEVDKLLRRFERSNFSIKALHGGYDQPSRYRVMSAFRTGEVKALLATDVASRGLDVLHVTHVINYSVPRELEDYTHRIGRTGRAGRRGTAVTFVSMRDARKWDGMIRRAKFDVTEIEQPGRHGPGRRIEPTRAQPDRKREEERPARVRTEEKGEERPARVRTEEKGEERRPRRSRGQRGGGQRGGGERQDDRSTRREETPRPEKTESPRRTGGFGKGV
jgi:superfamily II DNA/RNA helicase